MSRLKADKDFFEHIAASEHLARHVRELVWYELDFEAWANRDNEKERYIEEKYGPDDYTLVRDLLTDAACDIDTFWFPQMRELFVMLLTELTWILLRKLRLDDVLLSGY
ncbi:hypothetical protein F4679DRAFT_588201 [Xylaria curta]|nr:hypothetical protein F4679DRAFT_588201 [Xylaria curta]